MKRILATCVRAVVAAWIPTISILAASVVWAQGAAPPESPGIHLSVGVVVLLCGIVGVVGPGFYLVGNKLGKYEERLSSTDGALLAMDRRLEEVVKVGIAAVERMADAVEGLPRTDFKIVCPMCKQSEE
jgi:hypothetical protein